MRTLLALMIATVALMADEPTNAPPRVLVTTNYVKAYKTFRRVDGKLYNSAKSVLWRDIAGTCTAVFTNGIVVRTVVQKRVSYVLPPPDSETSISNILVGSTPLGTSVQTRTVQAEGPAIILVNYDGPGPTIGRTIRAKAIKVGTGTLEGNVMEKWDCGTVNVVTVIVTNKPAWYPKPKRQLSRRPFAK